MKIQSICADCHKEFNLPNKPNFSHGVCKRHFRIMLNDLISLERIEEKINKVKTFCDDLAIDKG